jgi:hypothetical protein
MRLKTIKQTKKISKLICGWEHQYLCAVNHFVIVNIKYQVCQILKTVICHFLFVYIVNFVLVTPILNTCTQNVLIAHNLCNAKLALNNALDIGMLTFPRFYADFMVDYILAI